MPYGVSSRSFTESSALRGLAGLHADAGHHAEALRLDEDLAVLVLVAADLVAERVVGAQEPLAVPAVLEHDLAHLLRLRSRARSASSRCPCAAERRVLGPMCTNMPAMNTDSAVRPARLPVV